MSKYLKDKKLFQDPSAEEKLQETIDFLKQQLAQTQSSTRKLKEQLKETRKENRELQDRVDELVSTQSYLQQINQFSRHIGSSLDLQHVADAFIEKAVQAIRADGSGSVMLYNESNNTFAFYSSYGLDPEHVKAFEISASPKTLYTYSVVENQRSQIFHYPQLKRFQNKKTKKLHYDRTYYQQLVTPLIVGEQTIGLVTISHYSEVKPFQQDDLELLENIANSLANHFENARLYTEMKDINKAIDRFVPYQFLKLLEKESILEVNLGDQVEKNMSILFSDIRSFTELSEQMTPEETFRFVNSYLSQMGPLVQQHNGFIDKYIGDSIMALFSNTSYDAIHAAIHMFQLLEEYNAGRRRAGYDPIQIGIGINTGKLVLGTLGDQNRMDGTVISDAVNLASRVEGLTKVYQVPLLISESVFLHSDRLTEYATRFIDLVQVKGRTGAVGIYEIIDADLSEQQSKKIETIACFEEAWALYRHKDFSGAKKLFQLCLKHNPDDHASKVYIQRCQELLTDGIPKQWKGVSRMEGY